MATYHSANERASERERKKREGAKANRTFETFLIELIISSVIRSRDIYISFIDNIIRKKKQNEEERKKERSGGS